MDRRAAIIIRGRLLTKARTPGQSHPSKPHLWWARGPSGQYRWMRRPTEGTSPHSAEHVPVRDDWQRRMHEKKWRAVTGLVSQSQAQAAQQRLEGATEGYRFRVRRRGDRFFVAGRADEALRQGRARLAEDAEVALRDLLEDLPEMLEISDAVRAILDPLSAAQVASVMDAFGFPPERSKRRSIKRLVNLAEGRKGQELRARRR